MLSRCRARQHNVPANDETAEAPADTPRFAEEPCGANVYPLLPQAHHGLRAEAKSLGLED